MNIAQKLAIEAMLQPFATHQLQDLARAALMNRVDHKFIFPKAYLPDILNAVAQQYTALELGQQRLFEYKNVYFDTADFDFYRAHHSGKLNRYKVRYRQYVESATSYLEVKFKNNKRRTHKQRIAVCADPLKALHGSYDFLNDCGIACATQLTPVQRSGYYRIALANEQAAERLTLDIGLYFGAYHQTTPVQLGDYVIAELKQQTLSRRSVFYDLMRRYGIAPCAFSKYCIGVSLAQQPRLKMNKFKPTLLRLQRLSIA